MHDRERSAAVGKVVKIITATVVPRVQRGDLSGYSGPSCEWLKCNEVQQRRIAQNCGSRLYMQRRRQSIVCRRVGDIVCDLRIYTCDSCGVCVELIACGHYTTGAQLHYEQRVPVHRAACSNKLPKFTYVQVNLVCASIPAGPDRVAEASSRTCSAATYGSVESYSRHNAAGECMCWFR